MNRLHINKEMRAGLFRKIVEECLFRGASPIAASIAAVLPFQMFTLQEAEP